MSIHAAVESFARESYGQALAWLTARAEGDIAAAEDALSEGLLAALQQWPQDGVPKEPVAWLITAARRRLIDAQRRASTRERYAGQVQALLEQASDPAMQDELLPLLFVCTHPAIDEAARAPLMLQVVMGLDAERIASAYLVSPATMSQRLVRAKARIKDAGIRFAVPSPEHWPERLESVLEAIYAAYTLGREISGEGERGLATEAISLARMLVKLLPDEQRTAIVLKEFHGLTFQEIADLQGCPLSTVKTRLYQGLTVLRRHLESQGMTKYEGGS